jgi:hypothetical protein
VPETAKDKRIITDLNKLLEANDRLVNAIDATRGHWKHVSQCWIDQTLEPTKLLSDHRLKSQRS